MLNHHGGTGSPDYGPYPISLPIRLIEAMFFSTRSYSQMILSGVFERFPKLQYINTEAGCAWVPETLARLDFAWERIRKGAAGEFEFAKNVATPEAPSFYAKRNCWYGASSASPRELRDREVIGTEEDPVGQRLPAHEGSIRTPARRAAHLPRHRRRQVRAMLGEKRRALRLRPGQACGALEELRADPEEIAVPLPRMSSQGSAHQRVPALSG